MLIQSSIIVEDFTQLIIDESNLDTITSDYINVVRLPTTKGYILP